jgi:hypothetical protein
MSIQNFLRGRQVIKEILLEKLSFRDGTSLTSATTGLRFKTKLLTDAQIKTLPTAAVEVVPAPGANKVAQFLFGSVVTSIAVSYTNIDAASTNPYIAFLQHGNDVSSFIEDKNTPSAHTFLTRLLSSIGSPNSAVLLPDIWTTDLGTIAVTFGGAGGSLANEPISIYCTNSGNFTGGDEANTMAINVAYIIVNAVTGELV